VTDPTRDHHPLSPAFWDALSALVRRVATKLGAPADQPVHVHLNLGESEERMRGYNLGFDAYQAGDGAEQIDWSTVPVHDPWRRAFLAGWADGWEDAECQDEGTCDDDA
jgi:hypothetical protein